MVKTRIVTNWKKKRKQLLHSFLTPESEEKTEIEKIICKSFETLKALQKETLLPKTQFVK